jgi:DNA-binding IclR family transcriptional regulator
MNDSLGATTAVSVVHKAGRLLRALGDTGGQIERSTSELARATGLSRPTAHRLLTALAEEGLAEREPATGGWSVGPELYLLGAVAAPRFDVASAARDILAALAAETGESAYLSAVRGYQTVCLLEEEGSFPLRSHVLHVGLRVPLGVASAGLVTLAHLPPDETEAYLRGRDLSTRWGERHASEPLRTRLARTKETGYAVNAGLLVEGSWGIGAAVFDRSGRPTWALSLTGVESRMRPPREHRLGVLLLQAAHALTQRLTHTQRG